jgi:hypothetical protein
MRGVRPVANNSVIDHFAKEFAKFLNRVQNKHADMLGSFLIESEWERYRTDASQVIKSFELSGYVIVPREPTEEMIAKADTSFQANKSLLGPRGFRVYVTGIYSAMTDAWVKTRDPQLITDIIAMALARSSTPGRKEAVGMMDNSFRRFAKTATEIMNELEKTGFLVLPDEPTPHMVSAAVAHTAEQRANAKAIGADPKYLKMIYENLVQNRPADCRPLAS